MTRPAVIFGGPSPEHDISILTGLQAVRTLSGDPVAIYWTKTGEFYQVSRQLEAADFAEGVPRGAKRLAFVAEPGRGFMAGRKPLSFDAIVNCCHGGPGEDGTLQSLFELSGLRATGPSSADAALGMDKYAFGLVMAAAGLPTLRRVLLEPRRSLTFEPPFIVKPRFGGSSIGIEVVGDAETAHDLAATSPHLRDGAVVEPFLAEGRDVNIAVRTYPEFALSAIEAPKRSGSGAIYDYASKYLAGGGLEGSERELPAVLPQGVEGGIREAAFRIAKLVGLRSVARIDFLLAGDQWWVNEVNTIPGSLAAYLFTDLSRVELLDGMVQEAADSGPRPFVTAGADGTALRSASSIAAKLG